MSVFKKYKGKRIKPKDKDYAKGTWYVWRRHEGRIIHKALKGAQTKTDAEAAEREIIRKIFNRKYGLGNDTKFAEFVDEKYVRYVEQNNVNQANKRLYIRYLKERFGKQLLSDIGPQDCRDVQAYFKKKYSASSVNQIMSTLSKIFTLACQEDILDRNPMQYVTRLKEPPPRERLLTKEEWERLWLQLKQDHLLESLVILALNLPLRKGQLLAIRPDAIDWETASLLTISSKGRSSRVIPLNSTALTTLRLMLKAGSLPFPLKDFRKRWQRALKAAKIHDFRFHDLRREFASELIRKNVNPNIVQKLFAHSDMRITNVYMHSELDELKAAVNSLDENVQEAEGVQ